MRNIEIVITKKMSYLSKKELYVVYSRLMRSASYSFKFYPNEKEATKEDLIYEIIRIHMNELIKYELGLYPIKKESFNVHK